MAGKGKSDRKSTRLNSSHLVISYAVFCLKKKRNKDQHDDAGRLILASHPLAHTRPDRSSARAHPRRPPRPEQPYPAVSVIFFFFNDTATTEIYTLSLHDALPISLAAVWITSGVRGVIST